MTAYVLTGNCNIRQLGTLSPSGSATARAGGDTVDTNGFAFTVDQDTRYGLTGATTYSLGSLTVNATKGGSLNFDARFVRLIPFNTGSGTITAGSTITCGSATGVVIGIYSALTTAPVLTGVATGWIKVAAWNGVPFPTSGAFTQAGYTFTITGPDIAGFIEVVGDEAATITANRLGSVNFTGAWYEVGTTSGSSATTYQLPTNGSVQYYPAVWVDSDAVTITGASWSAGVATYQVAAGHLFQVGEEVKVSGATPSGYNITDVVITSRTDTSFTVAMAADPGAWSSGGTAVVPEAYPCAGSLVAASSTATDVRGKCCWASTAGVLRFGSDGTNTVGYVPSSGRRIRIPNILTACCTTAARGTNALPNATLATRYDFTTTGGGVINTNKVLLNWYPSFAQAYSVRMDYTGVATQLLMSEVSQPMTCVQVAVGQEAANTQTALSLALCFAGGTFNSCKFTRAALATAVYIATLTDVANFTFNNCLVSPRTAKANVGAGSWNLTRATNCAWNDPTIIGAKVIFTGCSGVTFTHTHYADRVTGTTTTTAAENNSVWEFATAPSRNTMLDGLDFLGIANVNPYLQVLLLNIAGCSGVTLRNIGTSPSSLLSLGPTNAAAYLFNIIAGGAASDVKVQRCFVSGTRTNLYTLDNSSNRITLENVISDYADVPVTTGLNMIQKGVGSTPTYAAQVSLYGTHWFDHFTSATVGRIAILMNEPTALTAAQVSLTGGAAFTSAGGLYMPTVGMTATFEMPYYSLGHLSFQNAALVMAGGGAVGNFTFAYQIDTGAGFGAWSSELTAAALGTALSGLTTSAVTGFRLKLRITTGTANTTAITSVYILTNSSAAAQANYYPLESKAVNLTLTNVVPGSRYRIETSPGNVLLFSGEAAGSTVTIPYTWNADTLVRLRVRKSTALPKYEPFETLGTITNQGLSVYVNQILDPTAAITVQVTGSASGVLNQTLPFYATNNAGATFLWEITSGTATISSGQGTATAQVLATNAGAFTIKCTETASGYGTASATATCTIAAAPPLAAKTFAITQSNGTGGGKQQASVSVNAGDLIIVTQTHDDNVDTTACTDTAAGGSNVYNAVGSGAFYASGAGTTHLKSFYAIAKATETLTINVTTTSTSYPSISVIVIEGCLANVNTVLDTYAYDAQEGAASTAHTSASIVTTNANDIIVCIWAEDTASSGITENGTGFTEMPGAIDSYTNAACTTALYKIVTATGTYSDTVTSSASTFFGNVIMAFKKA